MTKIKIMFSRSVSQDRSVYHYLVWKREGEIFFRGTESRDGVCLYAGEPERSLLSEERSLAFFRDCADSNTHPCMLRELLLEHDE